MDRQCWIAQRLRVLHVNKAEASGGAAIAANRLHRALLSAGVESSFLVERKASNSTSVIGTKSRFRQGLSYLYPELAKYLLRLQQDHNSVIHSLGMFGSLTAREIEKIGAEVVNLHWVNGEMLPITEIGKIQAPIVWTLHDMWPFCGAEHYTDSERWKDGYTNQNRPKGEVGLDINRFVWRKKNKNFRSDITIVSPSNWLAKCAKSSALFNSSKVTVIPNGIDLEFWRPISQSNARELLGLPSNAPVILFSAMGGRTDPRKGGDLLSEALEILRCRGAEFIALILGESTPDESNIEGVVTKSLGTLSDEISLLCAYNAADLVIVPSRMDNLPNVAIEAQSCGKPVVGFNIGGLPDIIDHKRTGFLVDDLEAEPLAEAIGWMLESAAGERYKEQCRKNACDNFCDRKIAERYRDLYRSIK